jgi:hypothetical protein
LLRSPPKRPVLFSILLAVVWPGIIAAALLTLLGVAAPLVPIFELINHFRLFLVLGTIALTALAWVAGSARTGWLSRARFWRSMQGHFSRRLPMHLPRRPEAHSGSPRLTYGEAQPIPG